MNHFSAFLTGGFLLFVGITSNAQTKIKDGSITGTSSLAKPGAVLDLESNNRALLLPRVELTSTTSWTPLNGSAPGEGGYTIYNTSATTTEGSAAYPVLSGGVGEYYWDGAGWVAKKYNGASTYQEPFQVESTTTKATTNTQNIYQNGNLGLGDFSTSNPIAKLDVRGAVRGGSGHLGTVGSNSAAFGLGNTASGQYSVATGNGTLASGDRSTAMGLNSTASGSTSIAMGLGTTASGDRSTAAGNGSTASGVESVAMGEFTTASGLLSTALGYSSTASGSFSTAMGLRTKASSNYETVIGGDNAITMGTSSGGTGFVPVPTDAVFQVGNGSSSPTIKRSNALTILKNGNTGIAIPGVETAAKPTSTLQVAGSLSLAFRVVSGATELTDKDHTVVLTTPGNPVITLPDPAVCNGRIYRIIQYFSILSDNSSDAVFSRNVICFDGTVNPAIVITSTSLWKCHQSFIAGGETGPSASLTIQSDGTNWYAVGL